MVNLNDDVCRVRTAATANLKNLAEAFGTEWALTNVVSEVLDLAKSSNYLRRVTMLDAIEALAPVLGPDITCQHLLPTALNSTKDNVPNVKFRAARALSAIAATQTPSVVERSIKPSLVELGSDSDVDVRYFATQAIAAL